MVTEIITSTDLYWLTRLDNIVILSKVGCILGITGSLVATVGCVCEFGRIPRPMFLLYAITLLCLGSVVFVPTTKEMVAIKVIPMIANSQDVQGLGQEVIDISREWLKELKPSNMLNKNKETK